MRLPVLTNLWNWRKTCFGRCNQAAGWDLSTSNGSTADSLTPMRRYPLTRKIPQLVLKAARLDWSDIDPSIFGTLFERGLDPDKRSQLGAHYTDRDKIMMLVEPVIIRPLQAEWEDNQGADCRADGKSFQKGRAASTRTRA